MSDFGIRSAESSPSIYPPIDPAPLVKFAPVDIARRQIMRWQGVKTDAVQVVRCERFEYRYRASDHLLIMSEHAERDEGETYVDGLPKSSLRVFSSRLSFVPAGHAFSGWSLPRAPMCITYFYIDASGPLLDPDLHFSKIAFKPRLFFFDRHIWDTGLKLKAQIGTSGVPNRQYAEALGIVLAHELIQIEKGIPRRQPPMRGGLAGWQRRRVEEYVNEHFTEDISLSDLAALVNLSPYHFARAFKQSFGAPPHRYLTSVRMERAKILLARPSVSVTEIGRHLGFTETSSFSATFRKLTGTTPTEYRRSLE